MTQQEQEQDRPTLGPDLDSRIRNAYSTYSEPSRGGGEETAIRTPVNRGRLMPLHRRHGEQVSAKRPTRGKVLVAAAAAVLAVGVGTPLLVAQVDDAGPSTVAADGDTARRSPVAVDGAALRGAVSYDYEVSPSLTDLRAKVDVALSGTIVGWSEGRSVVDETAGVVTRYAVLKVEVDFASKVLDESQYETAFVSYRLGSEAIDGVGSLVDARIDDLERAAPAGARVIILGDAAAVTEIEPEPGIIIEPPDGGLPEGDAPLVGAYPQGFLLETAQGGVDSAIADPEDLASWGIDSAPPRFDDLLTELASD